MSSRRRNSRREKRSVAVAPIDQEARISGKRIRVVRNRVGRGTLTELDLFARFKFRIDTTPQTPALEIPCGGVGCKGEAGVKGNTERTLMDLDRVESKPAPFQKTKGCGTQRPRKGSAGGGFFALFFGGGGLGLGGDGAYWGLLSAGGRWSFFGDALFEGFHQVDDRSELRMLGGGDLLALALGLDHLLHAFHVIVFVFLGFERSGKAFDELLGEFFLGGLGLGGGVDLAVLGDFANFVGVEHRVERHALGARANDDDVLSLVHRELGDSGVAGLFHCVEEKLVGFAAFVFGRDVVRSVEVERVDFIHFYKFQYFHGASGLRLDLVELFFLEEDILVLFVFVALDDFVAGNLALAVWAVQGHANARLADVVELVEADTLGARGGKQPNGDGDQPEGEVALPDRSRHCRSL